MKCNYIFETRQEIDEWFDSILFNMCKGMATEAYYSGQASGEYRLLLDALNRTRERLYDILELKDKPVPVTFDLD